MGPISRLIADSSYHGTNRFLQLSFESTDQTWDTLSQRFLRSDCTIATPPAQ